MDDKMKSDPRYIRIMLMRKGIGNAAGLLLALAAFFFFPRYGPLPGIVYSVLAFALWVIINIWLNRLFQPTYSKFLEQYEQEQQEKL